MMGKEQAFLMRAVEFESTVESVSWSGGSRQISSWRGARRAANASKQHAPPRMPFTSS